MTHYDTTTPVSAVNGLYNPLLETASRAIAASGTELRCVEYPSVNCVDHYLRFYNPVFI